MNYKKLTLIANAVIFAVIIVLDVFFTMYGKLWLKGLTSACFVLAGGVNLLYALLIAKTDKKYPAVMLAGLFIAMLGDIVLNIEFIPGAALFAAGHILYLASYFCLSGASWKDLVAGACILVPSVLFITIAPIFNFGGALMEVVVVVYAVILSLMVGKAVSDLIKNRTRLSAIIAVGSILFFVSDFALLINMFSPHLHFTMRVLCLSTYYPAQFLLAFSIFAYAIFGNAKISSRKQTDLPADNT